MIRIAVKSQILTAIIESGLGNSSLTARAVISAGLDQGNNPPLVLCLAKMTADTIEIELPRL